jgi:hypothetical protein
MTVDVSCLVAMVVKQDLVHSAVDIGPPYVVRFHPDGDTRDIIPVDMSDKNTILAHLPFSLDGSCSPLLA